ncbi:MAG: cellulase family glycosylhydrolase [Myxococcota bacterium]
MGIASERRPRGIALLIAIILGAGCDPPREPRFPKRVPQVPIAADEFVGVEGTSFVLRGRPFRFVGANAAMMHGERTRAGMPGLFDVLQEDGVSVVRVWAVGESPNDGEAWRRDYSFRLDPEVWVEESYVYLDRLLVEARARNMRVIVTLVNRWGDYGGLPQYARWIGVEPRRRHLLPPELTHVLQSEEARAMYQSHVDRIVSRRNTVSGIVYRDDPTIFAWELANELSASTCSGGAVLEDWARVMVQFIRERDPNHLIAAGHIGYKTALSRESWRATVGIAEVSYASTHLYPQHLLGIDSEGVLGAWLADRARIAQQLQKPLVLGEFGIPREAGVEERLEFFGHVSRQAEANGYAGIMPWIYRSWDGREDPHGIWAEGPLADDTRAIRSVLRETAERWVHRAPVTTNPELLAATGNDPLYPLDLRRARPWPEGTREVLSRGVRLNVDPAAFAEGCAVGEAAWVVYVIDVLEEGVPEAMSVEAIGPVDTGASPELDFLVGGVRIGIWARGRFRPERRALVDAFATREGFRYLRIEARNEDGRAHLRRILIGLPSEELLELRIRW